jgi:hypothetical protein
MKSIVLTIAALAATVGFAQVVAFTPDGSTITSTLPDAKQSESLFDVLKVGQWVSFNSQTSPTPLFLQPKVADVSIAERQKRVRELSTAMNELRSKIEPFGGRFGRQGSSEPRKELTPEERAELESKLSVMSEESKALGTSMLICEIKEIRKGYLVLDSGNRAYYLPERTISMVIGETTDGTPNIEPGPRRTERRDVRRGD